MIWSFVILSAIAVIIFGCVKILIISKPYEDNLEVYKSSKSVFGTIQDSTIAASRNSLDNIVNFYNVKA